MLSCMVENLDNHGHKNIAPVGDLLEQKFRLTVELGSKTQIHSLNPSNEALEPYDLIAIEPCSEPLFKWCCEECEIADIISLDLSQKLPFVLKNGPVQHAIKRGLFFEIRYGAALRDQTARRHVISNARELVRVTKGKNLLISSEANQALDYRGPYDVVNLGILFGLKSSEGWACVSTNCQDALSHASTRKAGKGGMIAVKRTKTDAD